MQRIDKDLLSNEPVQEGEEIMQFLCVTLMGGVLAVASYPIYDSMHALLNYMRVLLDS